MDGQAISQLRSAAAEALESELRGLLEGASGDLAQFAREAVIDALEAARLPADRRTAVLEELRGQLRALAERHRLKAVNGAWDVAERVAMAGLKVAVAAALAA